MSAPLTDAEFLAAFEDGSLDPGDFHHADHVRAAVLMLRRQPLSEAASRYAAALRSFAARVGKADLYHETRTMAFLGLISDRLARAGVTDWPGFREANPDLLDKTCLTRFYTPADLDDPRARRAFVLPNIGAAGTLSRSGLPTSS